ncbi:MAG: hypothetical protein AVO35_10110 [Candidatus Aegiribacteria sp. MLS_C]|nr:MAG: hypothetical protein AVO35_10110 [Candidatus Aegiribacteria sp. MLS_C]
MNSERPYRCFRPADLAIPVFVLVVVLIQGSPGTPPVTGDHPLLEVHSGDSTILHPMGTDTVLLVPGNLGPLQVQVAGSRARVLSSPCAGQDCVRRGWLEDAGDMSVCVPSGVYIVLTHGGDPPLDAVSY